MLLMPPFCPLKLWGLERKLMNVCCRIVLGLFVQPVLI